MATYYAWSVFPAVVGENDRDKVNLGDEVSSGSLGVNKEEWQYLKETGSVRTQRYPEDIRSDESPTDYFRRKAAENEEGTFLTVEQVNTPSTEPSPQTEEQPPQEEQPPNQ